MAELGCATLGLKLSSATHVRVSLRMGGSSDHEFQRRFLRADGPLNLVAEKEITIFERVISEADPSEAS